MIPVVAIDPGPVPLRQVRGGASIPALGFGTWELRETCTHAVRHALEVGYRHIDTARAYQNEHFVGEAMADAGVPRESCWLTSKAWCYDLSANSIVQQGEMSLRELRTDYLDLFLIHWPNEAFDLSATIDGFRRLVEEGKLRHFGVSNFTPRLWKQAIAIAPEIVTNQVEYHPLLGQDELIELTSAHGGCLTAYSPLARNELFRHGSSSALLLAELAACHDKTPHQIALRWLIEQPGVVAIPASRNPAHIEDNFDIFDFELTDHECRLIDDLEEGRRLVHPEWAPSEWAPPGQAELA